MDLFGIEPANQWDVIHTLATHIDQGDRWESVWVYDHFHTVPEPTPDATHEAWTLMAALAASTRRVRLGQMCTCMGYRNPAYLAKVAATTDIISGGRVEMGIGAGWYEHEWRAYGYGFPRAGERLGMLDEGVQIMRQAWTEGVATLQGTHYQVDGAICRPLPLQDGGIPLWIAGGGEQKTLRIAARHADYTNFDATPETFRHKSAVLAEHCRQIGRDYDEITRSGNFNIVIGATPAEVDDKMTWLSEHYARAAPGHTGDPLRAYRDTPGVGTPEQIVANLRAAHADGLTYAICYFPDLAYDRSSLDLFESQVLPALAGL